MLGRLDAGPSGHVAFAQRGHPRAFLVIRPLVAAFLVQGHETREEHHLPGRPKLNLWPVGLISAALLLEAALISRLGWIPVVALVFVAGTYAFGDRRILANAVIGLVLATLILRVFTLGLGIDLPLGPLEPLFQRDQ